MKTKILNEKFELASEGALPAAYAEINPHNLFLYNKAYMASLRQNSAHTKTRAEVSGGGKKPWRQKGKGGARAGSIRSNIWVGGGVALGPRNERNYEQKINKKQKRLALERALADKAIEGKLFVAPSIFVESGKSKDAKAIFDKLGVKDLLIIKNMLDEKSLLAFRNLAKCYLIDESEANAYLVSVFSAVLVEEDALKALVRE